MNNTKDNFEQEKLMRDNMINKKIKLKVTKRKTMQPSELMEPDDINLQVNGNRLVQQAVPPNKQSDIVSKLITEKSDINFTNLVPTPLPVQNLPVQLITL